jgi:hypothetical protein
MLLFSIQWWILERFRLKRASPVWVWVVAILYALWSNLHPGFVMGMALLGLYASIELIQRKSTRGIVRVVIAGLATLINPYGWHLYGILIEHVRQLAGLQLIIHEWMSPTLSNRWMLGFWALLFTVYPVVLLRYIKDRKVPVEDLIALALFSIAASRHNRLFLYFNTIGIPLTVCHGSALTQNVKIKLTAQISATAAALAYFGFWIYPEFTVTQAFNPKYVPEQIAGFLKRQKGILGGHRYAAPLHWGGYLGFELQTDYPTFIDGRYIFYPLNVEMIRALDTPESYHAVLNHYGIDIVLDRLVPKLIDVQMKGNGNRSSHIIRPYYVTWLPEKDWALVYWNLKGLIFVRRASVPKKWLDDNEYRLLRPFDDSATEWIMTRENGSWKRLSSELDRFSKLSPDDPSGPRLRAWLKELQAA